MFGDLFIIYNLTHIEIGKSKSLPAHDVWLEIFPWTLLQIKFKFTKNNIFFSTRIRSIASFYENLVNFSILSYQFSDQSVKKEQANEYKLYHHMIADAIRRFFYNMALIAIIKTFETFLNSFRQYHARSQQRRSDNHFLRELLD